MNAFILQGRGSATAELDQEFELSLKWLSSDLLWGVLHLGLQHQVPGTSERRYWSVCESLGKDGEKKFTPTPVQRRSHWREELITTA